jgi:GDP-4-dehydro-6-deoxy-D-mannose reductase
MTSVAVTGAGGFLGRAVVRGLKSCGYRVATLGRAGHGRASNIHVPIAFPAKARDCIDALSLVRPALLIHLAAAAPTAPPDDQVQITQDFALSLFEAMAVAAPDARIVTIGSAAEYGAGIRNDRAMDEDDSCLPLSPYGAAKYAVTRHVEQGWLAGRDMAVLRLFTAAGPDMPVHTVLGNAARQIQNLPARGGAIFLGRLDVERDYLDVDEAARLIVSLALRKARLPHLMNIASNHAFNIAAIVARMIDFSNRSCRIERIERAEDEQTPRRVVGNAATLSALGLSPTAPTVDELALRALAITEAATVI